MRLVRGRAVLFLVLLGLLGGGGYFAFRAVSPDGGGVLGMARSRGADPAAIEAFLQGNRSYNADLVWNAYSSDAQERLRLRGSGPDEIKRQLAVAKERGTKIDEATFVGVQQLPDGLSMYFYLVRVSNPLIQAQAQPQSQGLPVPQQMQRDYVPYVFTLDASGKISRVQ